MMDAILLLIGLCASAVVCGVVLLVHRWRAYRAGRAASERRLNAFIQQELCAAAARAASKRRAS